MKFCQMILLSLLVVTVTSCRKQDIRVARISVPQMGSQLCVDRVVGLVRRIPGVLADEVVVDRERRDIAIPYDSLKLSLKNIEYTLVKAGYTANDVHADEKARALLPAECR